MGARSYRDLAVWQKGIHLAVDCYKATTTFPESEMYGLTSQIRRSATSIPANIAEGQGRQHSKEFIRFLGVARGSLNELETHLIISEQLEFVDSQVLESLLQRTDEIGRMISGLEKTLRKRLL